MDQQPLDQTIVEKVLSKQEAERAWHEAVIRYEAARQAEEAIAQMRLAMGADLAKEAQLRQERNRIIVQLENARKLTATPGLDETVIPLTPEELYFRRT